MIYQFHNGINREKTQRINSLIQSLEKQHFKVYYRSFTILKMASIPLPLEAPHDTMRDHPPNNHIPRITKTDLLTSPKMQHLTRHHHRPQLPSHRTMQQKMINTFTNWTAHYITKSSYVESSNVNKFLLKA